MAVLWSGWFYGCDLERLPKSGRGKDEGGGAHGYSDHEKSSMPLITMPPLEM
jgi:hypothetical protein